MGPSPSKNKVTIEPSHQRCPGLSLAASPYPVSHQPTNQTKPTPTHHNPTPGGKRKTVGGAVFFACLSVVAESLFDLVGSSAEDYRRRRALDRLQQPSPPPAAGAFGPKQ